MTIQEVIKNVIETVFEARPIRATSSDYIMVIAANRDPSCIVGVSELKFRHAVGRVMRSKGWTKKRRGGITWWVKP